MRQFFWKIVICILPVALATWVTVDAVRKYYNGDPGGFKLGVDLVGGTILVYEIDLRKVVEEEGKEKFDPVRDINVLAESLKRRIDPNDLYNIVIRPAGGEGRVEIILPTGGTHRIAKAEKAWEEVLASVTNEYKLTERIEVGRGKILELADKIQVTQSRHIWETKLFNEPAVWAKLKKAAYERWADLDLNPKAKATIEELDGEKTDRLGKFATRLFDALAPTEAAQSENSIESWIKQQAWEEMLSRARKKWPELERFKEDMERIPPDNVEQLVSFIQAGGVVIGQAGIAALEPLLGQDAFPEFRTIKDEKGKETDNPVDAQTVTQFIEENYGRSAYAIGQEITRLAEKTGRSRDLALEDVQRIKDLVAKVGSLEFRILANSVDDQIGIEDAKKTIDSPDMVEELEKRAKAGLPPPGPKQKEFWTINLPRSVQSKVTYSWVELGPQERKQLNLDNAAKNDAERNTQWLEAQRNKNKATKLSDRANRELLQGALFYTRDCKDQNLPEEERRQKQYEYFVLTRDPEIDPEDPTNKRRLPKIDGSYLVSAGTTQGADLRPAVSFVFNNAGGELFGDVTRKNVPSGAGSEESQIRRHLAIILDSLVMSAPTINSEIRTHGQISGSFTSKEVDALVNILRAGRLPATLKPQPVSESTMAATLGQDTIEAGVVALIASFFAVLAFMVIYYHFAGFVASVALLANLILTIGFMVAVQATFTLPGLAGLVLMLGMAVDANVLIYERFREERDKGASLTIAIRNAYDRSFPTIIDTHLSSMFTAVVLYIVGNDQLKGFGVSLTIGLLISLFTSLYMTRLMFDLWISQGWLKNLTMFRLFAKPDIDFMGARKFWFTTSVALTLIGAILFVGRLPHNLNIDFVGGTAYGGALKQPVTMTELRRLVNEENQKKWLNVQAKEEPNSGGLQYALTYTNPDGTTESRTVNLANTPLPDPRDGSGELAKVIEQREAIIAARAGELPDASPEQIIVSFSEEEAAETTSGDDASRHFVLRTTEKEPEIVQAVLDRVLRSEAGEPLMNKVYMKVEPLSNKAYRLRFFTDEQGTQPGAGSVSFVKSLLQRELLRTFDAKQKKDLPFSYDVVGEGRTTTDGKYAVMQIKFETDLNAGQRAKLQEVLQRTEREFAARPQPDRLENFDGQLATETRMRAFYAIFASWIAILIYVWFRFGNWTFGLAAVLCLVHDVFFTLGAITLCHYIYHYLPWLAGPLLIQDFKIDLTTVAALLTLVGYSINDKIVVYDRMREVRGKNPDLTPQIINESINQSLSRTMLTGVSVLLVLLVLYVFGGAGVHLFAFVMTIGMIVGTYSSIYVASPLLLIFGEGAHEKTLAEQRAEAAAAGTAS
jgi:SecD/SecF fusion protein